MTSFSELKEKERQALLYQSACNYLSRREHSYFELKQKLSKKYKEAEDSEIVTILDFLVSKNFQSDERFLNDFIESSVNKRYGPNKIKYQLNSKGVKLDSLAEKLSDINFPEIAKDLVERRYLKELQVWADLSFDDKQKLKAKITRLLSSRGFSFRDSMSVISSLDL